MPKYRYSAADADGRTVRGTRAANDEQDLYEKLKAEDQYLIRSKELKIRIAARQLRPRQLADFGRELGTLLGAGVPLVRAVFIISQEEGLKPQERAVYTEVLRLIRQGVALSDAMEQQTGVFPVLMISMFRAAETSGRMDQTANQLAVQYEKEDRMDQKIRNAIAYPRFLCILTAVIVMILVSYVLPQFEALFSLMEVLPLPTRILYAITDFLSIHWMMTAAALLLTGMAVKGLCGLPKIRLWLDWWKLRIPVVGRLRKIIYTARFARTLTSLHVVGVPIVTGLQIVSGTIGNSWIERQFDHVTAAVRTGKNLSDAIEPVDGFVKKLAHTIRVGEETGKLDVMLGAIAESLEYDAENAAGRLISFIEPALILVMALVVGFIMIAVMLPVYESYSAIEVLAYQ